MKYVLIGLTFLTLTFNSFALTPQDIYSNSVNAILILNSDIGSGTGFFLGKDGIVITNNHMVQNPNVPQKEAKDIDVSRMTGKSKNNREYSGFKLLYTDPVADIAVLKISNRQENDTFLELAGPEEKLTIGDDSFWIGNPGGLWKFTFSKGYLGEIEKNGNSFDLQFHGVGFHGSSGSPFLNKDGRIIGILATGNYRSETIYLESPKNGEKIELNQIKAHEGVVFGSSKESILKALENARANYPSNTVVDDQIININSPTRGSTGNENSNVSKNDLASLIRELKAYTPPSEVRLGSR